MELERIHCHQSPSESAIFLLQGSVAFTVGEKADCMTSLGMWEPASGRDRSLSDGLWRLPRIHVMKKGKAGVAPGRIVGRAGEVGVGRWAIRNERELESGIRVLEFKIPSKSHFKVMAVPRRWLREEA